jgi:hypothetical protein
MTKHTESDADRLLRLVAAQPVSASELAAYQAGVLDEADRSLVEAKLRRDPYARVLAQASQDASRRWRERATAEGLAELPAPSGTMPRLVLEAVATPVGYETAAAGAVPPPTAAGGTGTLHRFRLPATAGTDGTRETLIEVSAGMLYHGTREVLVRVTTNDPACFGLRLLVRRLPAPEAPGRTSRETSIEIVLRVDERIGKDLAGGTYRCRMKPEEWVTFESAVCTGDFLELAPRE